MLVEIGEDATTARSYSNVFVQGLLQTRAYAEAVIGNGRAFAFLDIAPHACAAS